MRRWGTEAGLERIIDAFDGRARIFLLFYRIRRAFNSGHRTRLFHPPETAMTNILQINASLFAEHGQSTQLADRFVANLRKQHPEASLVKRNLGAEPVPHLDGARFGAFLSKPGERTPEQQAVLDYSDALIAELKAADVIVLGLPMYNFGIPSQLKAYFDHIGRVGHTFRYTANGPVGLLTGKKAYVFSARGGLY